jgi:5-methylcytosine-specific restriction endonuclease McrA
MKKCDKPEREHVVPISRGGRDEESNVIPVCSFCNKSKNDRLLSEWLDVRLDLLK